MGTSKLLPDTKYMDKADNLDFAAAFARIECHYFVNKIFLEEAFILKNVDKILNIPVDIVQGRYDVVCPATSAWELHQVKPNKIFFLMVLICKFSWKLSKLFRLYPKASSSSCLTRVIVWGRLVLPSSWWISQTNTDNEFPYPAHLNVTFLNSVLLFEKCKINSADVYCHMIVDVQISNWYSTNKKNKTILI